MSDKSERTAAASSTVTVMGRRSSAGLAVAASAVMLLTACGGTEQAEPSATVTETVTVTATPEESPEQETTEPEPEPQPDDTEDGVTAFGDHFEWEDGIQIHVTEPTPYTPTRYASTGKQPENVLFTIRIVNGSEKKYSPLDLTYSMQSGNREAEEIYDSPKVPGGTPDTTLLPGREVQFESAWNLTDPGDLVFEVAPSFDHEPMYFTTKP